MKTKTVAALPIPDVPPGGACDELTFMEQLRRAASAPLRHTRLARQNCGSVTTRDRAGRTTGRFNAGPVAGACDLSGLASVTVGGVLLALRLEVEVKTDSPLRDDQKAYIDYINRAGGVALCVRYDRKASLSDNVARGVAEIDAAIAARVAPPASIPRAA